MKKRYSYALLFLAPGFFIAVLLAGALFGVVAGVLWLYVYGDRAWPAWTDQLLAVVLILAFFGVWIGSAVVGYRVGKTQEATPEFNARHLWIALGCTLLPIALLLLHQLNVGNLGSKPESLVCSEYCSGLGFTVSRTPSAAAGDRTCRCLGESGSVEIRVPVEELPR